MGIAERSPRPGRAEREFPHQSRGFSSQSRNLDYASAGVSASGPRIVGLRGLRTSSLAAARTSSALCIGSLSFRPFAQVAAATERLDVGNEIQAELSWRQRYPRVRIDRRQWDYVIDLKVYPSGVSQACLSHQRHQSTMVKSCSTCSLVYAPAAASFSRCDRVRLPLLTTPGWACA